MPKQNGQKVKQIPKKLRQIQTQVVPLQNAYSLSRGTMKSGDNSEERCVENYGSMLADPFSYQGEAPCALGYPATNTIAIKKAGRFLITTGDSNNCFVYFNPILGASEDTNSIAYVDNVTGGAYTNTGFDLNATGVNMVPLQGGIFSSSQLSSLGPDKVLARCIYAAIRVRPAGAVIDTSGICVGWQSEVNPDAIVNGDTNISTAQALGNVVVPLFNITSTTPGITASWMPQVYAEGDFIDPNNFATNLPHAGGKVALLISGAKKGFTFIAEVVSYYEYFTHTTGIALARPSHQDAAASSRLNEVAGRYRTYQGSAPFVSQLIETTSSLVRKAAPAVLNHFTEMGVAIASNYLQSRMPTRALPMLRG